MVVDFGDGQAFRAASGPALHAQVSGEGSWGPAVVETVAAAEALRALLGLEPHAYEFLTARR